MLCLAMIATLVGCGGISASVADNSFTAISAEQAFEMMNDLDDFILIDARTYNAFRLWRIAGAILIPHDEIAERAANELPDKDAMIFVYSLGGYGSEQAAQTLENLGYTNVYEFRTMRSNLTKIGFEIINDNADIIAEYFANAISVETRDGFWGITHTIEPSERENVEPWWEFDGTIMVNGDIIDAEAISA